MGQIDQAAGAGANLALACDLVVAARPASFVQAFSRIGLVPDSGGTWLLPRLAGHARAMGLAMLGERLPAEQAADWGLIWRCIDDEDFRGEVDTIARQLACAPTRALARTQFDTDSMGPAPAAGEFDWRWRRRE